MITNAKNKAAKPTPGMPNCVRCGLLKSTVKANGTPCVVHGKTYPCHVYGKVNQSNAK
jgi:hypothetical protein